MTGDIKVQAIEHLGHMGTPSLLGLPVNVDLAPLEAQTSTYNWAMTVAMLKAALFIHDSHFV